MYIQKPMEQFVCDCVLRQYVVRPAIGAHSSLSDYPANLALKPLSEWARPLERM